jgi:hypothetical protein
MIGHVNFDSAVLKCDLEHPALLAPATFKCGVNYLNPAQRGLRQVTDSFPFQRIGVDFSASNRGDYIQ